VTRAHRTEPTESEPPRVPDAVSAALAAITARALAAAANPHKPDAGLPEAPPKPCSRRLPGNCWCLLPDRHDGDCHGVTSKEALGVADFGPRRAVRR
jgi:hypothetical protein